jgi:hypothetical protein
MRSALRWLSSISRNRALLCSWSVALVDGQLLTSDGLSAEHRLNVADLRRVVVATDDSGPSDFDVVFLLYSEEPSPVGLFPIQATGTQEFVEWLQTLPGFQDRELARAMGSTSVKRFTVYEAPTQDCASS